MDKLLHALSFICCSLALYTMNWSRLSFENGVVLLICLALVTHKALKLLKKTSALFKTHKNKSLQSKSLQENSNFVHSYLLQRNSKLSFQIEVLKSELEEATTTIKDMVKNWKPHNTPQKTSSSYQYQTLSSPYRQSLNDLEFIESPAEQKSTLQPEQGA